MLRLARTLLVLLTVLATHPTRAIDIPAPSFAATTPAPANTPFAARFSMWTSPAVWGLNNGNPIIQLDGFRVDVLFENSCPFVCPGVPDGYIQFPFTMPALPPGPYQVRFIDAGSGRVLGTFDLVVGVSVVPTLNEAFAGAFALGILLLGMRFIRYKAQTKLG